MSVSWGVGSSNTQLGLSLENCIAVVAVGNEIRRWATTSWAGPNLELAIKDFGVAVDTSAFDDSSFDETIGRYKSSGIIASANPWARATIDKQFNINESTEKWFWAIVIAAGSITHDHQVQNLMTQLLQILKHEDRIYRSEVRVTTALEASIATAVPAVIESSKLQLDYQARVVQCNKAMASMRVGLDGPLEVESLSAFAGEGIVVLGFLTWLLTEERDRERADKYGNKYPTASLLVCKLAWLLAECGFSIGVVGTSGSCPYPKRLVELVTRQGVPTDFAAAWVVGVRLPFSQAPLVCRRDSILLAVARPYINYGLITSSWVEQAWNLVGLEAKKYDRSLSINHRGEIQLNMNLVQGRSLPNDNLRTGCQSIPKMLRHWLISVSRQAWQNHDGKQFHLDASDPAPVARTLSRSAIGHDQAASTVLLCASILRLVEPFMTFRGGPEAITVCGLELGDASELWEVVLCVDKLLSAGIHLSELRLLQSHLWAGEGWRFIRNEESILMYSGNGVSVGYQYLEKPGTTDEHLTQMILYDALVMNVGSNERGFTMSASTAFTEPRAPLQETFVTTLSNSPVSLDNMTCTLEPVWGRSTSEALHKYRINGIIVEQVSPWMTMLKLAKSRVFCSCGDGIQVVSTSDPQERCLSLDLSILYSPGIIPRTSATILYYKVSGSELHRSFCAGKHCYERCVVSMDCLNCAFDARKTPRRQAAEEDSSYVVIVGGA